MKQYLMEERLRAQIRSHIRHQYVGHHPAVLVEVNRAVHMNSDDWHKIFVEPWANFLKGVKVEAKKIAASAVVTVRLLFTLNQEKAALIKARYKDRMKEFQKETSEIMQKLGGQEALTDGNFLLFLANPGAYVAVGLGKAAKSVAQGTWGFAKEVGLTDKSIKTLKGEESEEDAVMRRREQRGPITKALKALEQIFLFAGHSPGGDVLTEAEMTEGDIATQIGSEIMAGPLGAGIDTARKELGEVVQELLGIVESVAAQNEFLAGIGSPEMLQNLVNMRGTLSVFEKLNPEGAKELNTLLDTIESDARALAADEEFQAGLTPPPEAGEEVPELSPEVIYEKALTAVTGEVFQDQYDQFIQLIADNRELLTTTFEDIFPPGTLTDDVVGGVDAVVPGFKSALRIAERVLEKELRS